MTARILGNNRIGQEVLWSIAMPLLFLHHGVVNAHFSGDGYIDQGSEEYGPPIITMPAGTNVNAELGKSLVVTCQAITGSSDKFSTIIYWLANQQFIEDVFEDGRVYEGKEIFKSGNGKVIIQKYLRFTEVTPEDFKTNFTCAVMNPSGSSVKNITLVRKKASFSSTGPCRGNCKDSSRSWKLAYRLMTTQRKVQ
ncbi:interleukin-1 receptor type 2-like [Scyliorhinus torazame]